MTTATLSQQQTTLELYEVPTSHFNSDSPRKRRKYRPGGPGGGGLWRDVHVQPKPEPIRSTRRAATLSMMPIMFADTPRANSRPRRDRPTANTPTYDSAADAVAATAQVDGYKPREERSWEEFHPDLDLEAKIPLFSVEEVDGVQSGDSKAGAGPGHTSAYDLPNGYTSTSPTRNGVLSTPPRRRPGRPPRRPESMLSGLGSPPAQRIVPLPTQNPRERLSLPKPVFRDVNVFGAYEEDKASQINYVNKTMEGLGYQKSDKFIRPRNTRLIRLAEKASDEDKESIRLESDGDPPDKTGVRPLTQVEYDMDEQDQRWLDEYNAYRKEQEGADIIKPAVLEVTMTQIEKEWHALERRIPKPNPKPPQTQRPRSSSAAAVNGELTGQGEEQDSRCSICDDGDCENTNAIVFCDGCDLAVHQECYGVPYIPEGQWLCRKCQQVGRGTPTCIFCPNTEGAFKMTTESKWVHLVCAIWIPEVSIANMSFMEPITQVADVPKSRWKLNCYLCNQKMGACIQCGNRNCFQAFHVTCARKARLYLKMKSAHGGPAALDASVLKAYCDKHVPPEWRAEYDVDEATAQAKDFYRREMRGRRWADSQQSALSMVQTQQMHSAEAVEEFNLLDEAKSANATPGQKRKRLEAQKDIWRLPSGAPVVPQIVLNAVENALQKFTIAKRKEFVAEACKYWSLKREARRGAALLKRLQLQMETFTTTELARRDFAAMGAAGKPKLQRRIDFAVRLDNEMTMLQQLCEKVKEREAFKLSDADLLRELVDTVYFPTSALLWPVLEKAKVLDHNLKYFTPALVTLQARLETRYYTSVAAFSADFGSIFQSVTGIDSVRGALEDLGQSSTTSVRDMTLTAEQKEVLKLAKRIIKAVQQPLHEATRKEAELLQKPFEEELRKLEEALDSRMRSQIQPELANATAEANGQNVDVFTEPSKDVTMTDIEVNLANQNNTQNGTNQSDTPGPDGLDLISSEKSGAHIKVNGSTDPPAGDEGENVSSPQGVPSISLTAEKDDSVSNAVSGGIPWYLKKFDISGTTVHDERWEGRERAMSAQLSEMDEAELNDMDVDMQDATPKASELASNKKASSIKKRKRTMFW